jgi:hypothetical protein
VSGSCRQGILFKFATDWHNLYGGDEFAMKAASHELKGCFISLLGCNVVIVVCD